MLRPRVPDIHASSRWWAADRSAVIAAAWHASVSERIDDARPCAGAFPLTPAGIALFAALSARRGPMVMLSHDPLRWPDGDPLLRGMPLVLPPEAAAQAPEAVRRGFDPLVLDPPSGASGPGTALPLLQCQGFVVQTSGSTGAPKVVFRPTAHVIAGASARAAALGLRTGEGVIGGVPLVSGHGVVQVVTAMILGGPLGLLSATDHREALAAVAHPVFGCWRVTPHFADVLGRCRVHATPRAPRICLISSAVARSVHDTFRARFGVPLRQAYSSSETGAVSVESVPDAEVQWDSVGHPLPGVDVRLGSDPREGLPSGATGRVWVRSPWRFAGYGVPPALSQPGVIGDWWPTQDRGRMDASGRLTLCGRVDDIVRTRDGRLVDPEAVALSIGALAQVREVVVVPVPAAAGVSLAAVVYAPGVGEDDVRRRVAAALPSWALPRPLRVVADLPRLPNGKPDRLACLALVSGEAGAWS